MCIRNEIDTMFTSSLSKWSVFVCCLILLCFKVITCDDYGAPSYREDRYKAVVNLTYRDPISGLMRTEKDEIGMYGTASRLDAEYGVVVHVRGADNRTYGCTPPVNVPRERWIALVRRGDCKFHEKITNAAIRRNASAVVIYNNEDDHSPIQMQHSVFDVVSIFINKKNGERIASLVDNGTRVLMHITLGSHDPSNFQPVNKTSVLFVSISFIVLMIISLAWLVFYYIQRFRYAHAKERLSKRLMNAAKKAITKMPLRTVKLGDKEMDVDFDQCAVCIEGYKQSDVIRILPCNHLFHKSCVDPWLIEQRSCPMCKLDILKAYGLQVQGCSSHENMASSHEVEARFSSLANVEQHSLPAPSEEDCLSGVIEIVHYQPPDLEYDGTPPSVLISCPKATIAARAITAESMESVRSLESDSTNELQMLMPSQREEIERQDGACTSKMS